MFAFTITTKDKCRFCVNDFDSALIEYFKSKGILLKVFYKLEESKYTKWHAHGEVDTKWETSKEDIFFVYFKEITDREKWLSYCSKNQLDKGTPFFLEE